MKNLLNINKMKNILLVLMLLLGTNVFAQFNGLQINLEKKSIVIDKNQRISVYCSYDGQHYYVGNKANPKIDTSNPDTWDKRDADTQNEISKEDFNRISEMALGLSSITLLGALDPSDIRIVHDPTIIELELYISGQSVTYTMFLPLNQNDFHYRQFEDLCEQIILLAGENPDVFLERKARKWYQR